MTSPQETVERALGLSRTDGCVVIADESSGAKCILPGTENRSRGEQQWDIIIFHAS